MKRNEGSVAEGVAHNCVLVRESARIETINEIVFFYLKRVKKTRNFMKNRFVPIFAWKHIREPARVASSLETYALTNAKRRNSSSSSPRRGKNNCPIESRSLYLSAR